MNAGIKNIEQPQNAKTPIFRSGFLLLNDPVTNCPKN